MTLAELQQKLTAVEPAAVLVSARVLERVIQEVCNLQGLLWVVPHRQSCVVDRHVLFRHVEQDDLIIESHQLLPSTVILLARPSAEEMSGKNGPLLLKYWRSLFHESIHRAFANRAEEGSFTDEEINSRIDALGRTEFEEIRAVLTKDHHLPREATDREVYIEFVAIFLELKYFAKQLLPVYFPALSDIDSVAELISQDFDVQELFEKTRLEDAPEPKRVEKDNVYESHDYYWRLIRYAEKCEKVGNMVKAAITRTRAARVAPAAWTPKTRSEAEENLRQLTQRLKAPLGFDDEQLKELLLDLEKLLEKADQGRHPVEAEILYELQKIAHDYEREIFALGLVEWILSLGKRPIKRPLPSQKMVQIIRHLRISVQKLTITRLVDNDRAHLTNLLHQALQNAEEELRRQFRPVLVAVFEDVGIKPTNPVERAAFAKMIEEFLDQILDAGFITFGDLRDIISRNQLKMPDLKEPREFIRGDALLQLDRRLTTLLDGVYRPSEFYSRWLERFTSLNFGTVLGRSVTLYITLPFGTAFLVLEGIRFILKTVHAPDLPPQASLYIPVVLGVFFVFLYHIRPFREGVFLCGSFIGKGLKRTFIDFPKFMITVPWMQRFFASWPAQLFYWYVFRPGLVTALLWVIFPYSLNTLWKIGGILLICNVALNSRTGILLTDTLMQGLSDLYHLLRSGLIANIYNFIIILFRQISHTFEFLLFRVDEWLRFRSGETEFSLFLRTLVSTLWYPIALITRFYWTVLTEPMLHPLKMPICAIAGKIILPLIYVGGWDRVVVDGMTPYLGRILAEAIGTGSIWLLPNAFGFLFWETKENWSLYKANRTKYIGPVTIGSHGEKMRGLLQPGFHSGTIPNLFDRLRKAESDAFQSGDWRKVRSLRNTMDEIKESISLFIRREMLTLLHECPLWKQRPLSVGEVNLASNRITVGICHIQHPGEPVRLQFESRNGWLKGRMLQPGWLTKLPEESLHSFRSSLIYLYKLAGLDLVHEQMEATLKGHELNFEISPSGLTIGNGSEKTNLTPLGIKGFWLRETRFDFDDSPGTRIDLRKLIFKRVDISWSENFKIWSQSEPGHKDFKPGLQVLPELNGRYYREGDNGFGRTDPHLVLSEEERS